ncbi:MAG: hypothetical protein AB8G23_05775 [Myxococcota bacterium]
MSLEGETPFPSMFPDLDPWSIDGSPEEVEAHLVAEARALYEEGLPRPDPQAISENPRIPAGYTYLAQFLVHDISFRHMPGLQRSGISQPRLTDSIAPFELGSVYMGGPDESPALYQDYPEWRARKSRFVIERNLNREIDLPRGGLKPDRNIVVGGVDGQRDAKVGDPRNDENLIIAQLHLAFLKFHNRLLDESIATSFSEAQQLTRWHYQWIVLKDLLPKLCGERIIDEIVGTEPSRPKLNFLSLGQDLFMPLELALGALRSGHAMIRPLYKINEGRGGASRDFEIFIEDAHASMLGGGREVPSDWTIQWDLFVSFKGSNPQLSQRISPLLARALASSPVEPPFSPSESVPSHLVHNLAIRTLLGGREWGCPSGLAVADAMSIPEEKRLGADHPLWIYCLKEASEFESGQQLGPVGAKLVAECLIWMMAKSPYAWFNENPSWTPSAGAAGQDYTLADFLNFARMPMTREDWSERARD